MQRFTYFWCAHLAQRSNYMTSVGHMSMNLAVEKLVLRYLSTGSENFIIELLTIWIQTNEKFSVPHANWLTVHDDSKSFNVAKEQKWEILSRTTLDTKNARIVHGTYAKNLNHLCITIYYYTNWTDPVHWFRNHLYKAHECSNRSWRVKENANTS